VIFTRKFLTIFLFVPILTFAEASNDKTYSNDLFSFKYPSSFKVSTESDEGGYRYIFLDGPGTSSITLTITPEPMSYNLREISNWNHEAMMKAAKEATGNEDIEGQIERTVGNITVAIGGKDYPGVVNKYSGSSFFDRSKFQSSVIVIYGRKNTLVVQEERRNEYIKKHSRVIQNILRSLMLTN